MAVQVNITLTALNGDVSPRHRFLYLSPETRTIQVGRASKSVSKGLLGAANNAWFDSPVMSRNHAEIALDLESNTVTLKDIGSMHGTFLNDHQLQPHEARVFNDGDNVVFGAQVTRGPESFPAVGFLMHYVTEPWKVPTVNTYAFPESSDIEDEQDYSDDDNYGAEEVDRHASEESVSMKSSPPKASIAIEPIDLTRDESEDVQATAKSAIDAAPQQAPPIDELENREEFRQHITVIVDDSDFGEADSIVESDYDDSDISNPQSVCSERDPSESGFYSENDDDLDSEMQDDIDDVNITSSSHNAHQISDVLSSVSYSHSSEVSQSRIQGQVETSENLLENDDDEDSQNDIGLSDAGDAGIDALFEDSFEDKDHEISTDQDAEEAHDNVEDFAADAVKSGPTVPLVDLEQPSNQVTFSTRRISFADLRSDAVPDTKSASSDFITPNASVQEQGNSIHRQPSPSDAAMVKTASQPISLEKISAHTVKNHRFPSDSRKITSQDLGEKTGKHAYFEAREGNRAKLQAGETALPSSFPSFDHSISEREEGRLGRSKKQPISATFLPMKPWNARRQKLGDSATFNTLSSTTTVPRVDFLYNPKAGTIFDRSPGSPLVERAASPELDMTSSRAYNGSKIVLATPSNVYHSAPVQPVRKVSIHDIIDTSSGDQRTQNLKRKANDISGVVEKEIQEWASSTPSTDISAHSESAKMSTARKASRYLPGADYKGRHQSAATALSQIRTSSHQVATTSTTEPSFPEQRPRKRLRKFMERAGYVALGGAAASAGLFSILVATAPEFL